MSHVLIPLDGSPLAEAAIPVAMTLEPERVTFLQVTSPGDAPADLEDALRRARERAGPRADRCAAITRTGRPAEAIVAAADEVGATVIALSTHGRTGFNRWVLGSVAEEVARTANAPVLLVRAGTAPPARPALERPLVGYDGSDLAWRAIEAVARLGAPGRVDLVAAHDVAPLGAARPDPTIERFIAAQRDELWQQLERAAERARGLGLQVHVEVREGRPSTVILEAAERNGSTLVAVATHGRSLLTRWVFGSVAEELLHTSPLPLLIVR